MSLQKKYNDLLLKYHMAVTDDYGNISTVIRNSINNFMNSHKRVGIYCYGVHTRELMTDYIYELRDIVCIVDNGDIDAKNQGFRIIKDEEIDSMKLDGIIISSYQYKDEIKSSLERFHKEVDVLDFYEELQAYGLKVNCEFFKLGTPYQNYIDIHAKYQKIEQGVHVSAHLWDLVKKFMEIKDFRLAALAAEAFYRHSENMDYQHLAEDIHTLYADYLKVLSTKGEEAVLLLCVDGLRAVEFSAEGRLKKTYAAVKSRAAIFTQAYSYSTSTFESLVPVFSENYDQSSANYMKSSTVSLDECRFASFAKQQGRQIYVYGSGFRYLEDQTIKYVEHPQTITQTLWNFANDLELDSKGLFYMQPVYESHFTFPSPYFRGKSMIVEGTSLFFDFLSTKGGKLRTKYSAQYSTAMRYIDDTLAPVLEKICCKTVLFADHGNNNHEEIERKQLEGMDPNDMTVSEDLIRIPLAIISQGYGGESSSLISLSEFNNIAVALMKNEKFIYKEKSYIRVGRTAIYNPDYKYIYEHIFHSEHNLCAFEGFIFTDGYKLIVFSNGVKELYRVEDDSMIKNDELAEKYYDKIKEQVSFNAKN